MLESSNSSLASILALAAGAGAVVVAVLTGAVATRPRAYQLPGMVGKSQLTSADNTRSKKFPLIASTSGL